MPSKNTLIAMALIACITFRLKLVGLLGSFFRKKYIPKISEFFFSKEEIEQALIPGGVCLKQKRLPGNGKP
jgi:hypothetical protein